MFCDFCNCSDCQYGGFDTDYVVPPYHAKTEHGTWICHTCYTYDLCTSGPDRNPKGPCDHNEECKHRPKLVTDWLSFHE